MDSTTRIEVLPGVAGDVQNAPYIEALRRYLIERRHAGHTVHRYINCAGQFLQWAQRERLDLVHIDEASVARFADEHLRADRCEAHATIGHLLVVLRTLGITAARPIDATPVDEELRRFDDHMDHVRGLAPRTRRAVLRIVREFLRWRFRDRPVVIPAIKPEHVRSCFVRLTERCHAPASMGAGFRRCAAIPLPSNVRRHRLSPDRCPFLPGELAAGVVTADACRCGGSTTAAVPG